MQAAEGCEAEADKASNDCEEESRPEDQVLGEPVCKSETASSETSVEDNPTEENQQTAVQK